MPHQSNREDSFGEIYADIRSCVDLGPPGPLPIWPPTLQALFELAVELLSQHNKTEADALLRYASRFRRGEMPFSGLYAMLTRQRWTAIPEEQARVLDELQRAIENHDERTPSATLLDDFQIYRRMLGRKHCNHRTVRRHAELIRTFLTDASHPYPRKARNLAAARHNWVREHLLALLTHLQAVSCNHVSIEPTAEEVCREVDDTTTGHKLMLSFLKLAHGTTSAQIRKILTHAPLKD